MVSWINANYIFFPDCMILKFSQHRNLDQTLRDVIQTIDTTRMSKLVLESDKRSQTEISVEGLEWIFFEFHVRSISWCTMLNSTASVTECCENGLFGNLTQLFVIECPNMDSLDILRMMIQCSPKLVNIYWDKVLYISLELVDTLIHCLTGLESLELNGSEDLVKGLKNLYYGNMSLKKTIELSFNSHLNAIDVENTCEFFKNVGNFDEVTLFTCDRDNNTQYDEGTHQVALIRDVLKVVVQHSPELKGLYLLDSREDKLCLQNVFNAMANLQVLEWRICWEYDPIQVMDCLRNVPASVTNLTIGYHEFSTAMICAMLQTQLSQNWVNIRVVTDVEIDSETVKMYLGQRNLTVANVWRDV